MIFDQFQGDPKLTLGSDGSNLVYKGGQPIMDQGLENAVMISLFTEEGWFGNYLSKNPEQKIGSKFLKSTLKAATVTSLNEVRIFAENALKWMKDTGIASTIEVSVTNPTGNSKDILIRLGPSGKILKLSYNGINWQLQALNPAYKKV